MPSIEQIEAIFHEALLLADDVDRGAWLARRCGGRAELVAEVSSLLAAYDALATLPAEAAHIDSIPEIPSEQFGAYRLARLLGRGGMSTVYLADRVDGRFDKQVAVKVMAAHLAAGEEFLKRLRTEAQFLATLEHPNIPTLLDSGVSPSGHPYLVVEYVEGEPLDQYCDRRKLGIEPRLRLFLQICQAVDHAHRALILHRDLKPSNVLVTADGIVKLLDFGTAALMAERSNVTVTRARMLTPRYASPEQLRGDRPGVTGDVFSLGVILYELLTGAWPFGDPASVMSELRRAAGHANASPPSAAATAEAAMLRSTPLERLKHMLAGDLAAILLKALENEPSLRYATVGELAGDVVRFLEGRPVEAHRQTFVYRASKFLRRRWLVVTAAAVFVLGLSAATVLALHQAQVAKAEARKAQDEAQKSARVTQFLRGMLTSSFRSGGAGVTVTQMLDAAEPGIEKSWKGDPLAEATLRASLGGSYLTLMQPDRAKLQLERALTLYQSLSRYADAADTLLALGINAQGPEGRIAAAIDYYQRALAALKLAGMDASPALLFRLKVYLAGVLYSAYRLPEARILLDEAIALAQREPSIPRDRLPAAWTHQAELLVESARFDEAEAMFHRAIAAERYTPDAWTGLARSNFLKQNFSAAAESARQNYELAVSYNKDHLGDAAEAELQWARYRAEAGNSGPAVGQIRAAMPDLRKTYPQGYMLAVISQAAARVFNKAGRFQDAAQFAHDSLGACRQSQISDVHPLVAAANEDLGAALAGLKRYSEAIPALEKALEIDRQLGPAYAPIADHLREVLKQARLAGHL
jgi:serine/threonine protein kinase/tetratricopeptide (TPR) repeat protein